MYKHWEVRPSGNNEDAQAISYKSSAIFDHCTASLEGEADHNPDAQDDNHFPAEEVDLHGIHSSVEED